MLSENEVTKDNREDIIKESKARLDKNAGGKDKKCENIDGIVSLSLVFH